VGETDTGTLRMLMQPRGGQIYRFKPPQLDAVQLCTEEVATVTHTASVL